MARGSMLHVLRRHPFPVEARFDHCLVLTYAVPAPLLEPLLSPGLRLDRHGEHGFVAVAVVQTRDLRPAGWPRLFGQDFLLCGYRIFTRFGTSAGRTLRGLRILRSDTDRRLMAVAGNLLTHYQYQYARSTFSEQGDAVHVTAVTPGGHADLDVTASLRPAHALPEGSPFTSFREARKFAGPLPLTFDHEPQTASLVVVEGRRTAWDPKPVDVTVRKAAFLSHPRFHGEAVLASAFHVRDVDYRWERGRREGIPGVGAAPPGPTGGHT